MVRTAKVRNFKLSFSNQKNSFKILIKKITGRKGFGEEIGRKEAKKLNLTNLF
jgi:hypothetical protein